MASYVLQNDVSVLKNTDGEFIPCIVYDAGQDAKVEFHFVDGFYHWYKDGVLIGILDVYEMLMSIELCYSNNAYYDKANKNIILGTNGKGERL